MRRGIRGLAAVLAAVLLTAGCGITPRLLIR